MLTQGQAETIIEGMEGTKMIIVEQMGIGKKNKDIINNRTIITEMQIRECKTNNNTMKT